MKNNMKHYNDFDELIKDKDNFPDDGMFYKSKSDTNIKNANFWVLSESEVKERKPHLVLPISIENTDAERWFDISLFNYLIDEKKFNSKLKVNKTDFFWM